MVKVERELSLKVVRNEYDIPDKFYIGDLIIVSYNGCEVYEGELAYINRNDIYVYQDAYNNKWIKYEDINDVKYLVID